MCKLRPAGWVRAANQRGRVLSPWAPTSLPLPLLLAQSLTAEQALNQVCRLHQETEAGDSCLNFEPPPVTPNIEALA